MEAIVGIVVLLCIVAAIGGYIAWRYHLMVNHPEVYLKIREEERRALELEAQKEREEKEHRQKYVGFGVGLLRIFLDK